ncbi:MAG: hypothetical protein LBD42_04385 [Desulfovibrio sp.]|jgi:hypothetical protein|nr:hypothetical protein [Desulfovibrio sp.]
MLKNTNNAFLRPLRRTVFSPREEEDCPAVTPAGAGCPEHDREHALFSRIMSDAGRQETHLPGLHDLATSLASPHNGEAEDPDRAPDANAAEREGEWTATVDKAGNPRWITLSVPERAPDGRIVPEEPLPPPLLTARRSLRQHAGKQKHNSGYTRDPSFRDDDRLLDPSGRTRASTRDIRPMRSLFRMLMILTVIGAAWYILSWKGWLPRLL